MSKVVGYIRVSTQGQVKDGYSLQYQVEEIKIYCRNNNLELLKIYKDKGISGAKVDEDDLTIEREGLQEMLADLQNENVEYVVVLNTSRLWRSDLVKVLIQRELKKHDVDVNSIEQPNYSIYNHDPNDFLVNGMLELLDQYQRLEIALKLSRGRKKKAQNGGYAGGRCAFGYLAQKSQKKLQVNEEQAEVVRFIFAVKNEHPTYSLSKIADRANIKGYRTSQDKLFTKVQIQRILKREDFYKGIYKYGQIQAVGEHTAIM
ncbi:MAG: recombinase family protein [Bacillota bacterium]|nr:recombinase family protein [Bacillota bacterium]